MQVFKTQLHDLQGHTRNHTPAERAASRTPSLSSAKPSRMDGSTRCKRHRHRDTMWAPGHCQRIIIARKGPE